ncbi:MAG: formyltetrahydrofolate deformylase [Opitutaceae bacterium]|nr:formyltetrahydrofolate deformylase [Cytophagales bacterium]
MDKHILLISCTDELGLISKISSVISNLGLNIIIMREFVEEDSNIFFMRMELSGVLNSSLLFENLSLNVPSNAVIKVNPKEKKDLVVYATKEYHCLGDLLSRHHFGELQANIKAVIANHEDLKEYTEKFNVPFHLITHEDKSKEEFEAELLIQTQYYSPDMIVLAKFMRILSPEFVSSFENKIINIHHSFLPAFIGANPYKKAFERGVKLIGATAHIVNNNLDEGPIITQRVIPVDHTFNTRSMIQAGREVERSVLFEALKLVLEDRVFVSGNKTIIFS